MPLHYLGRWIALAGGSGQHLGPPIAVCWGTTRHRLAHNVIPIVNVSTVGSWRCAIIAIDCNCMITITVGTHVTIATPRIGFCLEIAEALGLPVALISYKPVVRLTVSAVLGSIPALCPRYAPGIIFPCCPQICAIPAQVNLINPPEYQYPWTRAPFQ